MSFAASYRGGRPDQWAKQEVLKFFIQFMMNSTLLQSEFCIFQIFRLILIIKLCCSWKKRSVVNNCEESSSSIIPLFHSRTTFFFLSQSICLLLHNKSRLTRRNKNKNMQVILNLFYLAFVHITSSINNMI